MTAESTPIASPRPSLGWLASAALAAGLAGPAAAGEFPDEWFFSAENRPEALRALEGLPAPEVSIDTWIGDEVSLADLKGEVVIVDFWATWCGPCMAAIPKNVQLINDYGDEGLQIIGVHDSNSGWNTADQVVNEKGINYPVGLDAQGASVKAYSLSFWPTYVAVDRNGIVRAAGLRPDKLEDVVKVLLAEPRPAGTGGGAGGGAGAKAAEFPADWYVGGQRPAHLLALEGQPAPGIRAAEWLGGTEADRRTQGRVVVMHFLAPWSRRSRAALPALTAQAAELTRQGVAVIGVTDHASNLEAMAAMMEGATGEEGAVFTIARDESPAEDARLPIGGTAAAFGVRMWPMSVVIDRAGRVRAAGIRPDRIPEIVGRLMAERLEAPAAGNDA